MLDALLVSDATHCSQGDTSGRHSPKKVFAQAHDEWLIDLDGRRYLDLQMCNSAANFGYRSQPHVDALMSQAQMLPSLASEFIHEDRVHLAEELCLETEKRFGTKGRVHFSVGGAQAIDDALRLIGRATGTTRVFAFEGSYHGRTLAASAISGSYRYRALSGGVALADFVPFPYCNRCPFGKTFGACEYECVKQFARLFDGEGPGHDDGHGRSECRAFIAEPVLGRGGYLPPPPDYFRRLKAILDQHGILLVMDEVQMGFFRAGKLWTAERFAIVPDVIVFGKALTNGMFPLSGLWAREPLMSPTDWPVGSSHATFAGAPIGVALGRATLRLCKTADFSDRAETVGAAIQAICERLAARWSAIRFVNRMGAALSLDIVDANGAPAPALAASIVEAGLQADIPVDGQLMGVVLTAGGGHGNLVMLAPSLLMAEDSLPILEALLNAVMERVTPPKVPAGGYAL